MLVSVVKFMNDNAIILSSVVLLFLLFLFAGLPLLIGEDFYLNHILSISFITVSLAVGIFVFTYKFKDSETVKNYIQQHTAVEKKIAEEPPVQAPENEIQN